MGRILDTFKKIKKYTNICAHVALWTTLAYGATCMTKNMVKHNDYAKQNIEYKISESDYKQMNYLKSPLDLPAEELGDLELLNDLNASESPHLHLAFYSYALTNIALTDDSKKEFAIKYIDRAIQKSQTPIIKDYFDNMYGDSINLPEKDIHDNVLYLGHLNLMMDAYKIVSKDTKYDNFNTKITNALARNFIESPDHYLETYKGDKWPADNTVALASIHLYDRLNGTDHSEAIRKWKEYTLENMLDDNGLLLSHINGNTGKPDEEARGCALGYSIIFINMFDPDFSNQLYQNFEKHFYKNFLGVPFAREWLTDGHPFFDVDAGPVIMDMGTVASAFAIGASKANKDWDTFSKLSRAAEIFSVPYETFDKKGYLTNVSLGESVLLFCRTLRPWTQID